MNGQSVFVAGLCRCGSLAFDLHARPLMTTACHCTGCQKMTGSAFSLGVMFPTSSLVITQGDCVLGGLRGAVRHLCCARCLGWAFTEPPGEPGFVSVRTSLLDHPARFAPFMETWTVEKLPWAQTGAPRSFERFPDPGDYPVLSSQFSAWFATHGDR